MQQLEKKFFEFEADIVEGSLQEIKAKLNDINKNPNVNLVFVSNLVCFPNGVVGCIMQVKKFKQRGG